MVLSWIHRQRGYHQMRQLPCHHRGCHRVAHWYTAVIANLPAPAAVIAQPTGTRGCHHAVYRYSHCVITGSTGPQGCHQSSLGPPVPPRALVIIFGNCRYRVGRATTVLCSKASRMIKALDTLNDGLSTQCSYLIRNPAICPWTSSTCAPASTRRKTHESSSPRTISADLWLTDATEGLMTIFVDFLVPSPTLRTLEVFDALDSFRIRRGSNEDALDSLPSVICGPTGDSGLSRAARTWEV